jgi:NAD+ kinase
VWPDVEAILVVPLAAHALFARPLVVGPTSEVAVEVVEHTNASGMLFCDGRRTQNLPPGARVEVRRSEVPVRLARLQRGVFTDRLVRKFDLPVTGWRGLAKA